MNPVKDTCAIRAGGYLGAAAAPSILSPRFFVLWLHFSLDFALIFGILIYVDYYAWSAGACSRFSFLVAAIWAVRSQKTKIASFRINHLQNAIL